MIRATLGCSFPCTIIEIPYQHNRLTMNDILSLCGCELLVDEGLEGLFFSLIIQSSLNGYAYNLFIDCIDLPITQKLSNLHKKRWIEWWLRTETGVSKKELEVNVFLNLQNGVGIT